MPAFGLRAPTSADSDALMQLVAQSPDGGRVAFSPSYRVPFVAGVLARHPDAVGVVAELPGRPGLIGAAWISFGRCWLEGEVVDYAGLSSLVVHPDHRRIGVASALTRWRLDHIGSDRVVLAGIQAGNAASLANAKKWASQVIGEVRVAPMPVRRRPPANRPDLEVREARPHELGDVATAINAFYEGCNFARPQSEASLTAWLGETGEPLNHCYVATDPHGRLLAGVSIQDEAQLMTLRVTRLPAVLRAVNLAARVVPADGEMRNANAKMLWFTPGQASAAQHLWQTIRWQWRERSTNLVTLTDPRSPVQQMVRTPRWLPTTSLAIAVRSERRLDAARLIDPPV